MARACSTCANESLERLRPCSKLRGFAGKSKEAKGGKEERLPGQWNSLGVMAFISVGKTDNFPCSAQNWAR